MQTLAMDMTYTNVSAIVGACLGPKAFSNTPNQINRFMETECYGTFGLSVSDAPHTSAGRHLPELSESGTIVTVMEAGRTVEFVSIEVSVE